MMSKKAASTGTPAAVTAAAARADEIHKQIYPQPEQGEPTDASPDAPPAATPAETAPQDPQPQAAPQAAPQAEPQAAAPAAPAPQPDWEHRFNSMKGRFERAQEANLALQGQITELQGQLANMQQLIASMQAPPASGNRDDALVSREEIETYGEDFLATVGKRAKEVVTPEVKQLKDEIASLKAQLQNVTGVVATSAIEKLYDLMDRECPNWREINDDRNFIAWLGLPDEFSGVKRHDLLKAAFEQKNAPRVLAFFKGFLAQEAAPVPAAEPQPDPAPNGVTKVPLEALAAPGRAKTAATSAPAEKPVFTRAQISKFYVDKANGHYRGREDEAAQIERNIFEAQRAGRIQ